MSHIGKKPVEIPEGVEVKIENQKVTVSGSKGELSREVRPEIGVEEKEGSVHFTLEKKTKQSPAYWGTERALFQNMVEGVSEGFSKKLRLEGVGYRASEKDGKLFLKLGFSHEVSFDIPDDLNFDIKKKVIVISGIDKGRVSQMASDIRAVRTPDAYTGKGVRFDGEKIKLKPGKKAIGAE